MKEAWESVDAFRSKPEKGRKLSDKQIGGIVLFHALLHSSFTQRNAEYAAQGERPRTFEEFMDEQLIDNAKKLSSSIHPKIK